MPYGKQIAQLRSSRGLSQAELAKALGVKPPTVSNWENYKREPTIDSLCKLSEFFEESIDYIVNNNIGVAILEGCTNVSYEWETVKSGEEEAKKLIRAMSRLAPDERSRLIRICQAAYPEAFSHL